jgi:hypothetical protein
MPEMHVCPRCHTSWFSKENQSEAWTFSEGLCPACHVKEIEIQKKQEEDKKRSETIASGVPVFIFLTLIVALILLVVIAFVGYFRLGGFGTRFYQAILLWIISVIFFLLGESILLLWDTNTVSYWFKENIVRDKASAFNAKLKIIFTLYDLDDATLGIEDIFAIFLFFAVLAMCILGCIGLIFEFMFLESGDLLGSVKPSLPLGSMLFVAAWPVTNAACHYFGKIMT